MSTRLRSIPVSMLWLVLSLLLGLAACGQKGDLYRESAGDEREFKGKTLEQKEKELHQQQWDDATTRLRERN
jgi:predicted small lipoprotein YifL